LEPKSLIDRAIGKLHASRALFQFIAYLNNWREVWAAYREHRRIPALVFRSGTRIVHGPGDDPITLFREIFIDRVYTRGLYQQKPNPVIIDIGANVGFFALYMASNTVRPEIHCFEPAGGTRELLAQNVSANGLDQIVRIHPFAVSDRTRVEHLHVSANSGHRSFLEHKYVGHDTEPVNCLSLSEAFERCANPKMVDLLKIDVEGAEIEIFNGAEASALKRCRTIAVEVHDELRPGARDTVESLLRSNGFETRLAHNWGQRLGVVHAVRQSA
jgi:FkbM family methyltransferase